MWQGLSGGVVAVYPDKAASFKPEENIIVGNVCLYGAVKVCMHCRTPACCSNRSLRMSGRKGATLMTQQCGGASASLSRAVFLSMISPAPIIAQLTRQENLSQHLHG